MSEHKRNAHNDGNRALPLSSFKKLCSFMTRSRVFQSRLRAELCFHRYVHFSCAPIYIFGFHHKQCASD